MACSIGGLRGSPGMGAYQASEHAVIGLTRTAAHDFGPLGIRVNVLAPGPDGDPMLDELRRTIPGGVEAVRRAQVRHGSSSLTFTPRPRPPAGG
ncbi:SDR family NAD(P)-dependent oxidoreductase [Amycolatopsis sp. NPDC051102]|uniref:SDR family NAD(P)-dependent oxidoreductase n=1 Tax=Amycolatopsis sp. NPDC051102 TaxID=3155163 RepID=UPI0034168BFC